MPSSAASDPVPVDLLVDGHVHLYECMPVDKLVEAASGNFAAHGASAPASQVGVLFVADPEGVSGFERLRDHVGESRGHAGWRLEEDEDLSFTLRRSPGCPMTAIRGQQLITQEGLELLGIGCSRALASGLPLASTIDRVRTAGGWSIIAWGVGKWLGRRGRVVMEMIAAERGREDVMLGDNGGRPRLWSHVPQFQAAKEQGMRILAGTDPLPLKGEESRVGSYATRVSTVRSEGQTIAQVLGQALAKQDSSYRTAGEQVRIGRFLSNQLRLRLQRRSR